MKVVETRVVKMSGQPIQSKKAQSRKARLGEVLQKRVQASCPSCPSCIVASCLALTLLTGCGFQWRGASPLDISTVAVAAPTGRTELRSALAKHLRQQGTKVVEIMDAASSEEDKQRELLVEILDERIYLRPLSTNIYVEAADYEIRKEVDMAISAKGKMIMPTATLFAERVYAVDPLNLTASHAEQKLLLAEVDEELAMMLLRRLEAVAQKR